MFDFPDDQFDLIESAIEGIEVFRPKSADWRLPSTTDSLPNINLQEPAAQPEPISISRPGAIILVAIPLLLSMGMMLWQEFYQRSDPLSFTGVAAGLFALGVALALFFTYRTLRGANG